MVTDKGRKGRIVAHTLAAEDTCREDIQVEASQAFRREIACLVELNTGA